MELKIAFSGNKRVSAAFNGYTVETDQPKEAGGDGSAPAPFDLFLASIGTCAGIFVLGFCRKRDISTEGIFLTQRVDWDEERHRVSQIMIEIELPPSFPEKYRDSLVNTVNLCTVKRHLFEPPAFVARAVVRA